MKTSTSHLLPLLSACACALLAACSGEPNPSVSAGTGNAVTAGFGAEAPAYPATARGEVADEYHGTKVADPYRWLEQLDSEETKQWVTAQNKVTQPILEKLPNRSWLKERL